MTQPSITYHVYIQFTRYRMLPSSMVLAKALMQGKFFHRCTHLLYCSVLSLGGNVNSRRMSKPDMGSIFHIKKSMKYSGHRKLLWELSKLLKFNVLTSSDTKQTLMHLFLFTNSAQREMVSMCTTAINFPCITPLVLGRYILSTGSRLNMKDSSF